MAVGIIASLFDICLLDSRTLKQCSSLHVTERAEAMPPRLQPQVADTLTNHDTSQIASMESLSLY